jgi:Sec-independent protein translocase protein TatA
MTVMVAVPAMIVPAMIVIIMIVIMVFGAESIVMLMRSVMCHPFRNP